MEQKLNTTESPVLIGEVKQGAKIVVVLTFVLIISASILFLASKTVADRRAESLANQEKRLGLLAHGRVEMVRQWLESLSQQGDRLIKSDLFRLYASEVDHMEGDLAAIFGAVPVDGELYDGIGADLAAQLPMMQNMLREFSAYSGFVNARILNRHGEAYIATDGYLPPMSEEQKKKANSVVSKKIPQFSSLRNTGKGLELDVFVPMYSPDAEPPVDAPVGVLMMTRQVSGKITELLANTSLSAPGERTRLMQNTADGYSQVTPWTLSGFSKIESAIELNESGDVSFAHRASLSGNDLTVYSVGLHVNEADWWIVQEEDYDEAMAPIVEYTNTVYVVAGLGILTALLIAGLAWWVLTGVQSQRIAEKFRQLAETIDAQKRFIDSINANVEEFILLKDISGKYTYVNEAFAEAVGRSRKELLGMDASSIFGFDTAKRLSAFDESVLKEKKTVTLNEPAFLRSQKYQFQVSKSPYCDSRGNCTGIVEVYRDISEFIAVQAKHERLVKRAMEALGATIEAADPYLGGHTQLMACLALEVAKAMHFSEMEIAEIETAANLSQIGKMFVPHEILTKPGKLTDAEMHKMEKHVQHAYRILKDIEISDGVLHAIYQMNERIDGTGYPNHLKYDEIILSARILSVVNVFCAMIRPRSYRGAKTPEVALGLLQAESTQFDAEVVEKLGEVLNTPVGEKLLMNLG